MTQNITAKEIINNVLTRVKANVGTHLRDEANFRHWFATFLYIDYGIIADLEVPVNLAIYSNNKEVQEQLMKRKSTMPQKHDLVFILNNKTIYIEFKYKYSYSVCSHQEILADTRRSEALKAYDANYEAYTVALLADDHFDTKKNARRKYSFCEKLEEKKYLLKAGTLTTLNVGVTTKNDYIITPDYYCECPINNAHMNLVIIEAR